MFEVAPLLARDSLSSTSVLPNESVRSESDVLTAS